MDDRLKQKLKNLPGSPGVYFHKSKSGEIIYVGKAAVLKNRVRQYFQSKKTMDVKTLALVSEIYDTDWVETDSEIDALFLESEMVKRYMPRYNILLRDDKSQMFIRINMKDDFPYISYTRNPSDDGAEYFGPYYNGYVIKKALRYLRKSFPYFTADIKSGIKSSLDVHIGLSPSPDVSSAEYKTNLRRLVKYIEGGKASLIKEINSEMRKAAENQDFEKAAKFRNIISNLRELQQKIMFGDKEFLDISKDHALSDLVELLGLESIPVRIEGYDISHMSGTNVVASMVVFTNGVSDRAEYRKFKTKIEHNNDFYNMNETISRRFSEKNIKSWGNPNLVVIDGGKGQLGAAIEARDSSKYIGVPFIGLAKKQEQIVVKHQGSNIKINKDKLSELNGYQEISDDFILLNLPDSSHVVKLLQRIRDESHRFAVSYHTVLKRAQQTSGVLDSIPGIGPVNKRKLLKKFGSVGGISSASEKEVAATIGKAKAKLITMYLDDK